LIQEERKRFEKVYRQSIEKMMSEYKPSGLDINPPSQDFPQSINPLDTTQILNSTILNGPKI
jgi:hypothetical protein